jgi:hypothetical protein
MASREGMSETSVHRRGSETTRVLAALAFAMAVALMTSGCSPGADYPSIFPAVHDMPPPRAETPLDSLEIQRATEDLITARDHLSAEAQGQPKTPTNSLTNVSTAVANPPPSKKLPATQAQASAVTGSTNGAAAHDPQAGNETKP